MNQDSAPAERSLPEADAAARRRRFLLALCLGVLTIAIMTVAMYQFQFATRSLIATDGYFHIKFSYLMSHGHGIIRELPWLQYTIHRDHYRDHHFLFHVLLIPFTYGDLRLGGKVAAWLFASLAMAVFYLVTVRRGPASAAVLTLLLLAAGKSFLTRMNMTRVPALSLLCMLLALHLIITRRRRWLAGLMFAYVWLYDGFAIVILFLACFTVANLLIERRFDWRTWAWAGGGMAAGIVINPYFPSNVASFWFNLWRVSGSAQLLERTGWEWKPFDTLALMTDYKVVWIVLAAGIVVAVLHRKRTRETVGLLLVALAATFLVMKARRYTDTWPPLAFMFTAYAWSDFWRTWREETAGRRRWPPAVATAALALLLVFVPGAYRFQIEKMAEEKPFEYYKGAAEYIRQATLDYEGGILVFNTDWDDFPFMFFFNSDCHYVVGLDQLYMKQFDEENGTDLFAWWQRISAGDIRNPSEKIAELFKASYVVVDLADRGAFANMARLDRGMKLVYPSKINPKGDVLVFRVMDVLQH